MQACIIYVPPPITTTTTRVVHIAQTNARTAVSCISEFARLRTPLPALSLSVVLGELDRYTDAHARTHTHTHTHVYKNIIGQRIHGMRDNVRPIMLEGEMVSSLGG